MFIYINHRQKFNGSILKLWKIYSSAWNLEHFTGAWMSRKESLPLISLLHLYSCLVGDSKQDLFNPWGQTVLSKHGLCWGLSTFSPKKHCIWVTIVLTSGIILQWQLNQLDATHLPLINHMYILKVLIYLNRYHTLKFTSSGDLVNEDCSQLNIKDFFQEK